MAVSASSNTGGGGSTPVCHTLPLVGSGLVWGPAAIILAIQGRPVAAVLLAIWGVAVVGSVDNLIRPIVYNRYARIHPMVTLVGAIAGVSYMGLLGLLLGPLAISYFFELIRLYRAEYGTEAMESWFMPPAAQVPPGAGGGTVSGATATGDEVEGNPS